MDSKQQIHILTFPLELITSQILEELETKSFFTSIKHFDWMSIYSLQFSRNSMLFRSDLMREFDRLSHQGGFWQVQLFHSNYSYANISQILRRREWNIVIIKK